jgi:ABC-type transport system involved in multi-copper enzyme maturation permease subunit
MYFWKSWRDARLAVAIFMVPLVVDLYGFLRRPGNAHIGSDSNYSADFLATFVVSLGGILLLFVAWSLGGDGIGHEITEDGGAYLLTRPRTRRFFLWHDSGFAFALMAVLAWATMLFFELVMHMHLLELPNHASLSPMFFLLVPLSGLVCAGLVYAVSYLCTMLIPRDKTARAISVAVLIAYTYLHFKALHTWGGVTPYLFPSWWVDPFPYKYSSAVAAHLPLALGARVIAILVLLLMAQLVLERREIRA